MVLAKHKQCLLQQYLLKGGEWILRVGGGSVIGIGLLACTTGMVGIEDPKQQTDSVPGQGCGSDPDFVAIPGGDFIAGSDRAEQDYAYLISAQAAAGSSTQVAAAEDRLRARKWFDREPARQIQTLPEFCIGRNLVTNADYQTFVQTTGHRPPGISEADYQTQGFLVHSYSSVQPYLWNGDRHPPGQANHPVVLVSYEDALAYAQWKGQQDQQSYRLPTALEWEKATRGQDGRYFPWGNQWRADATNWSGHGPFATSEVAVYPLSRSVYGSEDMAGNVFEYTSSLVARANQTRSVMKGCSWDDLPGFCRAAYQHTRPITSRHILFGYRLVRE